MKRVVTILICAICAMWEVSAASLASNNADKYTNAQDFLDVQYDTYKAQSIVRFGTNTQVEIKAERLVNWQCDSLSTTDIFDLSMCIKRIYDYAVALGIKDSEHVYDFAYSIGCVFLYRYVIVPNTTLNLDKIFYGDTRTAGLFELGVYAMAEGFCIKSDSLEDMARAYEALNTAKYELCKNVGYYLVRKLDEISGEFEGY